MRTVELEVAGRKVTGQVEKIQGTLWVHINGKTFAYDAKTQSINSDKTETVANGEIQAPMPGRITRISVRAGDKVAAQQVLIVMEAMKMEYYLKASCEGFVRSLACQEGDQVEMGQSLLTYGADSSAQQKTRPFKVFLTLEADSDDELELEDFVKSSPAAIC
jgi:acetyl/propionyl-CoA carboxylase alpha subunit